MSSLLSFSIRRELQGEAVSRFGDKPTAPSETFVGGRPPRSVVGYLQRNRKARATFRRISRNAGKRLVRRTQKRQWAIDLIDTRLMVSSWRYKLEDIAGNGLKADIALLNDTPYARYAHQKGRKGHPFVRVELRPIVMDIQEELAVDQAEFVKVAATRIAADVARSAFLDVALRGK